MEKGNNSHSQSHKSGGSSKSSSKSSQAHGGKNGAGGSPSRYGGMSNKEGDKICRELAWQMAEGCANSYPEKQFLANYLYEKYYGDE